MRTATVAAGLVGALAALTACSGGGGDKTASPSPTPSATATSAAPSASGSRAVTGASAKLQGSWIATSGGKIVALVITGKKAGLFVTGRKAWCQGVAGKDSGMQMIHLTCPDGNKDRGTGMVDSVDGKGMTVKWSGKIGEETYTKAEGGKLPSTLPTKPKH
ncbi:hypothetical protein M878_18930 [Streptomyces roseochromogenus subsp. oscitans DS 12.976]|uniref:Lipoprotein n=1 Tax=Streptomyces roseochromogenus subsp. oscitans DS 12.976 TaxID=1352936 RepID=V6KDJ6_STRRC|nr:hypothetical protein M878_18930 [Streptomyces roseochromogenus subsp. oscitans DS 12.976]